MDDITYSTSSQERFIDAYQNGNWFAVRDFLNIESGIEINCNDEQRMNLLYYIVADSSEKRICVIFLSAVQISTSSRSVIELNYPMPLLMTV